MTRLTSAVQAELNDPPLSLRHIARVAGLSPALVSMIATGERIATPEAAAAIAHAFERAGEQCLESAGEIRRVLTTARGKR